MLRRSQGINNLSEILDHDTAPQIETGGIRRLSRNFGIFDPAIVRQVAQDPNQLEQIAQTIDEINNTPEATSTATPAA